MSAFLAAMLALWAGGRDTTASSAVLRAPLDTALVVNFRSAVQPETVYVGQQATYELGVFVDASVRDRLRRMEAIPPEMRGLMAYEPPATLTGFPVRALGRRRYEAHLSLRAVFPIAAGRYVIAPARLAYAMPLSYSFFSREESFELRSDSTVIVAVDPPAAGRPADYSGAVGALRIDARLDSTGARVGDPLRLTLRVSGAGNVKLFPRPAVDVPWATAIPAGDRVVLGRDSITIRGIKEFDWVLTPSQAGRRTLPSIRYPYFDPAARKYAVAVTAPVILTVAPGALAAVDTGAQARRPVFELRAEFRGALPPPLYRRTLFMLVMALVPVPALALAWRQRPRRAPRRRRGTPPDQILRELARRGAGADLRPLRRAFLDAVALRLRAPSSAIAEPEALRNAARRAGTSGATAAAAAAFIAELNAAAFAAERRTVSGAGERALSLYKSIDAESRRWRTPAGAAVLAVTLLLAAAGAAMAMDGNDPAQRFAAGVEDFGRGRYAQATQDFRAVAAAEPRAADAWANFGTAAFAAGDTVHAVAGWQRALRLEPVAGDVRDRLDLIAPAPASAPGAVPPIPPEPLNLAAALLWAAAWTALALRLRRREPVRGASLALTALGAALVIGAAGFLLDARLAYRDLAVARREAPLRIQPALGADRASVLHMAETVQIVAREGPWALVVVERDRIGWLPADALLPLAGAAD